MRRKRSILRVASVGLFLSALTCLGMRVHQALDFNTQYDDYMRAAVKEEDPKKSVVKAEQALAYLEAKELTSGRTAILYNSPDTDVGDWYSVVSTAVEDFKKSDGKNKDALKKAVWGSSDADVDTKPLPTPTGISIHPNNRRFVLWGWGSLIAALALGGCSFLVRNTPKPASLTTIEKTVFQTSKGTSPVYYLCGNMPHVIYRTNDFHLHDCWWNGHWNDTDLTVHTGANVLAACDPIAIVNGNLQRIIFRGYDNCLHELQHDYSVQSKWQHTNLTQATGVLPALA